MQFNILTLVLFITVKSVSSARILGVFPIPSLSHQVVFRRLYLELAKSGHQLVVITPNPAIPKNETNENITEIDVSFSYEYIMKKLDSIDIFHKKVIADVSSVSYYLYEGFIHLIREQIKDEEVGKLIKDKNQKFDLILIEAYFSLGLVYSHIFKAPVILISSFHGLPENYDTVGAPSSHLTLYPNFNRNKFRNLNFWEKNVELFYEIKLRYEFWKVDNEGNRIIKELFGPDAPTIDTLRENVDMLFVNSHPLFANNRPVPPSVVFLGGLQMQPVKDLPEDLKHYLDSSKNGVVYVSLGTNILPSRMDKDLLYNFIDAFEKLPYDILWKYDGPKDLPMPKNVKTQLFFPQRDLLLHPKIKAFVTQGGLQSSDEAIEAAVPLVGIPMVGDQFYNVHKYVELGIGVQLDAISFTHDDLVKAVNEVIDNEIYKENIINVRSIKQDEPMSPLERAVWWVEHVIRHNGARHLRSPAANISWLQYLDIYPILIPVVIVILILFSFITYCAVHLFGTIMVTIYCLVRFVFKKCFFSIWDGQPQVSPQKPITDIVRAGPKDIPEKNSTYKYNKVKKGFKQKKQRPFK